MAITEHEKELIDYCILMLISNLNQSKSISKWIC